MTHEREESRLCFRNDSVVAVKCGGAYPSVRDTLYHAAALHTAGAD